MVNKILKTIFFFGILSLVAGASSQTASDMQAQMDSANVRQSAADVAAYETPYLAFNTYFEYLKVPDLKGMTEAMTEEAKSAYFGGSVPPDSELATISDAIEQEGHSTPEIESFYYFDDLENPRIKVTISTIHNQLKGLEEMAFTFVDTQEGWKISKKSILPKGKTAVE